MGLDQLKAEGLKRIIHHKGAVLMNGMVYKNGVG
jgi:hypothetical protein